MKYRVFIVLTLLTFSLQAQKVGLVLSGGGARGIAHVGVLQALEENGIPIDYITGTSMGAIVGGLYSIGMSPEEIIRMISSKEFLSWSSGYVERKDIDYFKSNDPSPEFFSTYLSLNDSTINRLLTQIIPMSVINPIHLNYNYMELFGPYSAMSGGDFDRLFVPFRCVAADVYTRSQVVFHKGNLEDAIRASMSIPVVFNPVSLDTLLLFDGGLYNNYPIDVMKNDFSPDYYVGSSVSMFSEKKPAEDNLYAQLEYLIMNPASQTIPQGKGVEMSMEMPTISTLQFEMADTIYKMGYQTALAMIDSIKKTVKRRVDPDSLTLARKQFREQAPQLVFYDIEYHHVSDAQKEYISKTIGFGRNQIFTLNDFRKAYYDLLSDKRISEIIPKAVFNKENQMYKLDLDIKIKNNVVFSLGGNVSSTTDNQLYANIGYYDMGKWMQYLRWDAYVGSKFTASSVSYRMDFAGRKPSYLQVQGGFSFSKYYEGEKLFYEDFSSAFIRSREFALKFRYGIPVFKQSKLEFTYGFGRMSDFYMQKQSENFTEENFDKSYYDVQTLSVRLEQNTLNHRLYPTEGQRYKAVAQYVGGWEYYSYPDSVGSLFKERESLGYFQISAEYEAYKHFKKNFSLGYSAYAVYNNKRPLDNYMADVIQAKDFSPTPYTKTRFNEAFRANQYLAVGVKPIFILNSFLNLQCECYGFLPIQSMSRGDNYETVYRPFAGIRYMSECSLVFNQPFFSTALFVHHSSYPQNDWNVGLNIGFLLFPASLLE